MPRVSDEHKVDFIPETILKFEKQVDQSLLRKAKQFGLSNEIVIRYGVFHWYENKGEFHRKLRLEGMPNNVPGFPLKVFSTEVRETGYAERMSRRGRYAPRENAKPSSKSKAAPGTVVQTHQVARQFPVPNRVTDRLEKLICIIDLIREELTDEEQSMLARYLWNRDRKLELGG